MNDFVVQNLCYVRARLSAQRERERERERERDFELETCAHTHTHTHTNKPTHKQTHTHTRSRSIHTEPWAQRKEAIRLSRKKVTVRLVSDDGSDFRG